MPSLSGVLVMLAAAFPAAVAGGALGFGTGLVMLPIVAWVVGVRASVPVLTIEDGSDRGEGRRARQVGADDSPVQLAAAPPRAREIPHDQRYTATPPEWLSRLMGLVLLSAIPLRRWLERGPRRMRLRHFPLLGAGTGFLSALVAATGPIAMPFFLGYGLRRGAYIGTDAVCAAGVHLVKTPVYGRYALLTPETSALGLATGGVMFAGAFVGRLVLDRMSDRSFVRALEALVAGLGVVFLVRPPH